MSEQGIKLSPILHVDAHTNAIKADLMSHLADTVFKPLVDKLDEHGIGVKIGSSRVQNASDFSQLTAALRRGDVVYVNGRFSGKFNAGISRELQQYGAKWFGRYKAWVIDQNALPSEVRGAIQASADNARAAHEETAALLLLLASTFKDYEQSRNVDIDDSTTFISLSVKNQHKAAVSKVKDKSKVHSTSIDLYISSEDEGKGEIDPLHGTKEQLEERSKSEISEYLRTITARDLMRLREKVLENMENGADTNILKRIIESEWDKQKGRMNGLAEAQASKFISTYRKKLYTNMGINMYTWRSRGDERVRAIHQQLNGQQFFWEFPPMAEADGTHHHPGEGYNCRCVPIAFVPTNFSQ